MSPKSGKAKGERPLCPRCGGPISYFKRRRVGDRVYVYAVHYEGYDPVKKSKITRECYLGPEDAYEYVSRLHDREGLTLRGLADRQRILEYLDAIIAYLERNPLDPRLAQGLADRLEKLAERLRSHAEEAEAEEEE